MVTNGGSRASVCYAGFTGLRDAGWPGLGEWEQLALLLLPMACDRIFSFFLLAGSRNQGYGNFQHRMGIGYWV